MASEAVVSQAFLRMIYTRIPVDHKAGSVFRAFPFPGVLTDISGIQEDSCIR